MVHSACPSIRCLASPGREGWVPRLAFQQPGGVPPPFLISHRASGQLWGGVASRMRKLSCGECVPCRHGRPGFGLGLPDLAAAQAGPPGPPRYRRAGSVRGPFFSRPTFLAASWPPSPRGGPCHQALLLSCSSLPPHHLGPGALGSSPTRPQPTVHRATLGWRGQGANL